MNGVAMASSVITLMPGDVALGERGDRLETLLGSCVAIVLTDPRRTVGAMCHVVHGPGPRARVPASSAYGEVAVRRMAQLLQARGIVAQLCEAYVYGGGDMFPHLAQSLEVGDGNARWATQAVEALGARLLGQDLGGTAARRLSWTIGPGAPQVVALAD